MEEGTGVDRISELPEPILHHIQSLLLIKEAARTSALSKTWNTVWSTLPFLNFDKYFFRRRYLYRSEDIEANSKKLFAFIDKTLRHRRRQGLRIEKFGLSALDVDYNYKLDISGHLDNWIDCLTVCNIDELMIGYVTQCLLLPPSLFTIESLTTLNLWSCKLPCPAMEHIKLPNLRKLCLEYVEFDDQLLRNIFSICHMLEYLLVHSYEIQRLQISGLPNLKIINTQHIKDVEVEASNLQELTVSHVRGAFGPPPKFNPAYCGNTLKCLTLSGISVKDDAWFNRLIHILQVLETLSLTEVDYNVLRISSPSLKHLNLGSPKMAFEAEFDTPNLQSFRYSGELLKFSLNHNLALRHVEIQIGDRIINGEYPIKLIKLLQKFNHSEVVKLCISDYFEFPMEMREKLHAPLPNVKHFICRSYNWSSTPLSHGVTQVLDVSLWLSSSLKNLFINVAGKLYYSDYCESERPSYDESFEISLKFIYEDQLEDDIENGSCCHCDSIPFRCWRHSLKTVEIEKTRGSARIDDGVRSIKNYFMANLRSRSESDVSRLFAERWVDSRYHL